MKINLQNGQKLFFTSDLHYNHRNLCKGTSKWDFRFDRTREYETIEEMNQTILDNINSRVGENDILFLLGDISFGGIEALEFLLDNINCKNLYLTFGNHDHLIVKNENGVRERFVSAKDYMYLTITSQGAFRGKKRFALMHYPLSVWNNMAKGVIHLHGHCHLREEHKIHQGKSMDVGMDGNDLQVYSLEEVCEILESRPNRLTNIDISKKE